MRNKARKRILKLLTAPGPHPDVHQGEITLGEERIAYTSPVLKHAGFSVWYRHETSIQSAHRWTSDLHLPGHLKEGRTEVYMHGAEALYEVERLCRLAREVIRILQEVGDE
jgi:hypothetical protein